MPTDPPQSVPLTTMLPSTFAEWLRIWQQDAAWLPEDIGCLYEALRRLYPVALSDQADRLDDQRN